MLKYLRYPSLQSYLPYNTLNLFDKRGLTTAANLNQVKIHRKFQRKPLILTTNFWNLLKEGIIQQDIILCDGDTVIVPAQDNIDITQTCTIQCTMWVWGYWLI
ncbi:MAG: hypothetical protein ACQZ3M_05310 [cyanobacterium endosymbiont of Rhopalodia fuxianensis]